MQVHTVEQNTLDWMRLHLGIPTASTFDALVTPEFKLRDGEMPKTLVCKKVAEKWRNQPLIGGINSFSAEQGMIVEEEARPYFELLTGAEVDRPGFITSDDGKSGCSPDGLILVSGQPASGLEIKCPNAETHVKYLAGGVLPKDYRAQVHGSMFVTGLDHWTFMSYRRGFPPLIVAVERDEAICAKIGAAIDSFHIEFDRIMTIITGYEATYAK